MRPATFLSLTIACGLSAPAQYTLSVNNQCSKKVFVAVSYRNANNVWVKEGWKTIDSGQIFNAAASSPNPYFYIYAESEGSGLVWNGDNKQGSISTSVRMEAFAMPNDEQAQGTYARTVSMYVLQADAAQFTHTLTCPNAPVPTAAPVAPAAPPPPIAQAGGGGGGDRRKSMKEMPGIARKINDLISQLGLYEGASLDEDSSQFANDRDNHLTARYPGWCSVSIFLKQDSNSDFQIRYGERTMLKIPFGKMTIKDWDDRTLILDHIEIWYKPMYHSINITNKSEYSFYNLPSRKFTKELVQLFQSANQVCAGVW